MRLACYFLALSCRLGDGHRNGNLFAVCRCRLYCDVHRTTLVSAGGAAGVDGDAERAAGAGVPVRALGDGDIPCTRGGGDVGGEVDTGHLDGLGGGGGILCHTERQRLGVDVNAGISGVGVGIGDGVKYIFILCFKSIIFRLGELLNLYHPGELGVNLSLSININITKCSI